MSADSTVAHLTSQSLLPPAIKAWEMYLNDQGRSPNTVKAFLSDVRILTQFLPPDRTLGAITTKDLNRYFEWMEKERPVPCSPKTLARRITSTKSFFRWLHQYGVLLVDPAEKVLQRSVMSPLPTVLTEEEVQVVLQAADSHRHERKPDARPYTLVNLLLSTGIRRASAWVFISTTSIWKRQLARWSLSAMPARLTVTRNVKYPCLKNGFLRIGNTWPNTSPWTSFFLGLPAG